jgi:N6-adenosine-specific RNA methylase IME4
MRMSWRAMGKVGDPFEADRRYRVIYADPPWSYRDRAEAGQRGAAFKYPLLNDEGVAALPVDRIAADDAMLFLWVTWPKLAEVLPIIDAWGFRYRTVGFVWVKRTRISGALAWGMGSWTRANTEPCLFATRGRPGRVSAGVHQVIESPLARHSEKPAEARERIVRLAGEVSRIELFARQVAPGWDAWGNDLHPTPDEDAGAISTHELPACGSLSCRGPSSGPFRY